MANAIYTLSPGHDVEPEDDPVAPFLFGDKRGYCVHFAHAMTYMLRALGVPARVGTGYLTDLSQSKDGHILLRMSDRHAWAEVYVQKKGWLPFDVQPEKVESHADSAVDMELLEELMSKLEPGEEILPESTLEGEENVYQTPAIYIPSIAEISIALGVVLILFVGLKLFLVFGWYLTASSDSALRRAYISLASQLLDLGFPRHVGETRTEYRERLKRQYGLEMSAMINALNEAKYGTKADLGLSLSDVRAMQRSDKQLLKDFPWWKRVLAFLSPASLVRGLLYSRW